MKVHDLAARLDAQERRLVKLVTIDGSAVATPDDFTIETHAGEVIVPHVSRNAIRVIAVPCGKFLKAGAEPDTLHWQREVRATGVYEVETEWRETMLVPRCSVREVAALIEAPEEPEFAIPTPAPVTLVSVSKRDIADVANTTVGDVRAEQELARVEAHLAKMKAESEPRKVVPFRGPRAWADNQISAWRQG